MNPSTAGEYLLSDGHETLNSVLRDLTAAGNNAMTSVRQNTKSWKKLKSA